MSKYLVLVAVIFAFQSGVCRAEEVASVGPEKSEAKELMEDAAVAALIIAGSIAAYKALGKPCACPGDTMRNGRRCGGNSAWSRGGGAKPLCFTTDVSPSMISVYRNSKAIPPLW